MRRRLAAGRFPALLPRVPLCVLRRGLCLRGEGPTSQLPRERPASETGAAGTPLSPMLAPPEAGLGSGGSECHGQGAGSWATEPAKPPPWALASLVHMSIWGTPDLGVTVTHGSGSRIDPGCPGRPSGEAGCPSSHGFEASSRGQGSGVSSHPPAGDTRAGSHGRQAEPAQSRTWEALTSGPEPSRDKGFVPWGLLSTQWLWLQGVGGHSVTWRRLPLGWQGAHSARAMSPQMLSTPRPGCPRRPP